MRMKQIFLLVIAATLTVMMVVAAMARLVEIGHLQGNYNGVTVDGVHAYCVGPGLDVVNIENPRNPWVEGSLDSINGIDVFVYNGIAYVACLNESFLEIIDISIPSDPVRTGKLRVISPVAVSVSYPYACVCGIELGIVDVYDPLNPKLVGSLEDWVLPMDVQCVSPPMVPYVFATRGYWGGGEFGTIDISKPTNPTLVGALFIFPPPRGIDYGAGYAYVAASSGGGSDEGLVVIDISNPTQPNEIARCHESYANQIAVGKGYAVLTRCYEFSVIDVHDPGHPIHVQTIYSPEPEGVCADDDYFYLADLEHGLSIFRFFESPQVNISLVPEVTTVVRGDTLVYDVTLTNMTDEEQTFQFGALVRRPSDVDHVVIEPTKVVLPPQEAKTKRIKHPVPLKVPLGVYIYIAKVGATPIDIWDEDRFQFEVVDDR